MLSTSLRAGIALSIANLKVSEGLVRLSIRLEGVDDILADLAQALPQMPIRTAA
ncbi:MAG: PLP-dependent transferase [Yoonia sp.]|nr:PLP-dependent transferase [Yoonia sp.]